MDFFVYLYIFFGVWFDFIRYEKINVYINLNKIRFFICFKYIVIYNFLCSDLFGVYERIYFD